MSEYDLVFIVLLEQGFATPTEIQKKAIPAVLRGNDVIGAAETVSVCVCLLCVCVFVFVCVLVFVFVCSVCACLCVCVFVCVYLSACV